MSPISRRGRWVADVHFRRPDGSVQRVRKVSPVQEKYVNLSGEDLTGAIARLGAAPTRKVEHDG